MRLKHLSMALLIALLASGCDAPPLSGISYFPLTEDRSWLYRIERTTHDGKSEIRQHLQTIYIEKKVGGIEAVRQTAAGEKYKYEITNDAVSRVLNTKNSGTSSRALRLILPANVQKGARWSSETTTTVLQSSQPPWEKTFKISANVPMRYEVLSSQSKVVTSAGSFENCLHVRGKGSILQDAGNYIGQTTIEIETEEWFAPEIGVVKILREERTGSETLPGGTLHMELLDWK